MRRIAGGAATVAIAAFAVLPNGAHAAQTIVPSSVERSATVPAGDTKTLRLACPDTGIALHGALVQRPAGVVVRDSIPGADARRWTFRLAAASGASDRRVTVILRCVRLRLATGVSGVTLRVTAWTRPELRVPPRASLRAALTCKRGQVPTGYGVGATSAAVSVAAAVPTSRGWTFRLENRGSSAATATARIRCLERTVTGRRRGAQVKLGFDFRREAFDHTVQGGSRRDFSGACARDRVSVATGVSLDPDADISLTSTYPMGRWTGVWLFRNSGSPEPVKSYLLCLARDSRFR